MGSPDSILDTRACGEKGGGEEKGEQRTSGALAKRQPSAAYITRRWLHTPRAKDGQGSERGFDFKSESETAPF